MLFTCVCMRVHACALKCARQHVCLIERVDSGIFTNAKFDFIIAYVKMDQELCL
uniref:Uncharacterized protein n=1 Tax=Anguilla anguilla TaxID=7936 RepID=A0A0E9WH49_ANGAN